MRVAIMGAGGVGGYVGARLTEVGDDVTYFARGTHLAALKRDGIRLEGELGALHLPKVAATDDPASIVPVDFVLFTVKLWDADQAAKALAPVVAPHTRVLTLQNGIDAIGILARHLPREQVVGGVIYISAVISSPGVVRTVGVIDRIIADRAGGNPVMAALAASAGRATNLNVELTDQIGVALWEKFIRLSALSGSTALMRSGMGPILANTESRAFVRDLIDEGVAVAAASGNPVGAVFADDTIRFFERLPADMRASMAHDLDAGHRLELPWLSGRMHALGQKHGVATPAHTAAYRALILHADGHAK